MSRAGRKTRRLKSHSPVKTRPTVELFKEFFQRKPDPRSHAEFLRDMRSKQAAGKLVNPATAALIDRLEQVIHQ
jgi:hypothetical protein